MSLPAARRSSLGTLSLRGRAPVSQAVFYTALAVFALVWFAPVFILVFTSLKSAADFAHGDTFALPKKLEWGNFARAWEVGIKTYFVNSTLMTLIKVPAGILVASLTWTSTPLPGEAAKPPALVLSFSGNAGPAEVPPLTSSKTVAPASLGLYWYGSDSVVVSRSGECGCVVDYRLTLTGPAVSLSSGPF